MGATNPEALWPSEDPRGSAVHSGTVSYPRPNSQVSSGPRPLGRIRAEKAVVPSGGRETGGKTGVARGDSRFHLCSTASLQKRQAAQRVSPSRLSWWLALAALQRVGCPVLGGGPCLPGLGTPAHEGAALFPETGLSRARASCLAGGSQSRQAAPPLSRPVLRELLVPPGPGPGLSAQGLSIRAELQSSAGSLVTRSSLPLWETPVLWVRGLSAAGCLRRR